MKRVAKCIVKGCDNYADKGRFVGPLCAPCHTFITEGVGVYSQVYRNARELIVGDGERKELFAKVRESAARLGETVAEFERKFGS